MPAVIATAPGKIILFGEHAVVYGRPAIAVPVEQVKARAIVSAAPNKPPGAVEIQAPDIGLFADLADLPTRHPIAVALQGVFSSLSIRRPPAFTLRVTSTIPSAAGLGSGAAVAVAIIRAVASFLNRSLSDELVSSLAFEVEKLHHGSPSGLDNTVIAHGMPVYFVRGQPIETLRVKQPFTIVIGDTGVKSPTKKAVGDLAERWRADPAHYEPIFDAVGVIAQAARKLIEDGQPEDIGPLMDENHRLLRKMTLSCAELDRLVDAGRAAGALGAKLSGGGRGGNMIALASAQNAVALATAIQAAGAVRTWITEIRAVDNTTGEKPSKTY